MAATNIIAVSVDSGLTDEQRAFPREVFDFLLEFAVAHGKLSSYPATHPAVQSATELVAEKLRLALDGRMNLAVGITREGFVVDDVTTDPRQRLLKVLARKLHDEQLGGMMFMRGVEDSEIRAMFDRLVRGSSMNGSPLGLGIQDELNWPHVRLTPIAYDRLELAQGPAKPDAMKGILPSQSQLLWHQLASVALGRDNEETGTGGEDNAGQSAEELAGVELPTPASIAEALKTAAPDVRRKRSRAAAGVMIRLVDQARASNEDVSASSIQRYLSELIGTLDDDVLQRLIEMEDDPALRRKFVVAASEGLASDAVVKLARAAAESSKVTISSPMLRMMSKMAANSTPGDEADQSVRSLVRQCVGSWSNSDGAPADYVELLDVMAVGTPEVSSLRGNLPVEPASIVAMALEIGALTDPVRLAADSMVTRGNVIALLDMLANSSVRDAAVRDSLRSHVLRPETMVRLLRAATPDYTAIERLSQEMGVAAADAMLHVLCTSEDRTLRARMLSLLAQIGAEVGPRAVARLQGAAWFVQRNILELLGKLDQLPADFAVEDYARNQNSRVRRAALRLLMKNPQRRTEGILTGLQDNDDEVILFALASASESCPPEAHPVIKRLFDSGALSEEAMALCIRVLAARKEAGLVRKLVSLSLVPRRLLRKERLQEKSAVVIAAIKALATHWPTDPEAIRVLQHASASPDPEIRAAASRSRGVGP
jgi:hypothetical protein